MAATATPCVRGLRPYSHPGMEPHLAEMEQLDTARLQGHCTHPRSCAGSTGHPIPASTSWCSPGYPQWCHQHLLLYPLCSTQLPAPQRHLGSSTGLG